MKNIHVLPTDKPSRLHYSGNNSDLLLSKEPISFRTFERSPQNICITNSEEIKEGDWCVDDIGDVFKIEYLKYFKDFCKKIILTTDQDLIKNGVQAIDDEFLEWFVKNPSCEEVEVEKMFNVVQFTSREFIYKIIPPKKEDFKHEVRVIPKEEVLANRCSAYEFIDFDKQETLEEFIESQPYYGTCTYEYKEGIEEGAKWQQKNSYSEEDMKDAYEQGARLALISQSDLALHKGKFPTPNEWFKEFKKK